MSGHNSSESEVTMEKGTWTFACKHILRFATFVLVPILSPAWAQEGWQWKDPLPQGNGIQAVRFLSSNSIVAVALCGTALRSSDGGDTWVVRYPGTPASLRSVWFVNESIGFAVGHSGAIVKTIDGGNSWVQSPIVVDVALLSVCFSDVMVGTVVGNSGTILRTTDGGANWTVQNSGTLAPLNAVGFFSELNGIAVGGSGTILGTTDGGTHWIQQTSGTPWTLNSVLILDSHTGVAVGDYGTILLTTNGGSTWIPRTSSTSAQLTSVCSSSPSTLFIIGNCVLLRTTDGGDSWSNIGDVCGADISFHNDAGVIVGAHGSILVTTDGGSNWIQKKRSVFPEVYFVLLDVTFSSPTNCVAVGYPGMVLRSSDEGNTWVSYPGYESFETVSFVNANNGFALGYQCGVRTTDGGSTWVQMQTAFWTMDAFFWDDSTGIAVGESIYRTTNAGDSWTRQGGKAYSVRAIQMVTPQFGVAAGASDVIKTTDGGMTWTEFPNHPTETRGIYFVNETSGTIVGRGNNSMGGIARTTDGGNTWSEQYVSQSDVFESVAFWGIDRGIAVGSSGTILLTTDGGTTWEQRHSGAPLFLWRVRMVDSSIAIAVGSEHTILRSSDGGVSWITVSSGTEADLMLLDVTFPTHDIGYVLFQNGHSLGKTTDSGKTWTWFDTGGPGGRCIFFTSPTRGFLPPYMTIDGGATWHTMPGASYAFDISFADYYNGIMWDNSGPYRTTDGGETWSYYSTREFTDFDAVSFVGRDLGLAVGGNRIARTTNGGISWSSHASGTSHDLYGVVMNDTQRGVAIGHGGTIIRTSDGGMSWFPVQSGTTEVLRAISFPDALNGTIIGNSGVVLTTNDGGETWTRQSRVPAAGAQAVSFRDRNVGVMVGGTGILRTTNGGVTAAQSPSLSIPSITSLEQNYPNPFNPQTTIEFTLSGRQFVELKVFDLLGREVAVLVNEVLEPGMHRRSLDGTSLASGVYFYRLHSEHGTLTNKMLLLK
jgi:photosystem II stability/assembly factor-like uncharacterized protein